MARPPRQGDIGAALLVLALGAPLTYAFASAISAGQSRAHEAPYRALLGAQVYEALSSGETSELHYIGDDRLAPDFTLTDRSGRPWRLSDHRGKVVVMNFWTITCQPCIEEMPSLIELAEIVKERDDVEVITISTDRDWEQVASLFPRSAVLGVLFDPERSVVSQKFGTRLFPETWVIDADGVIRLRIDGPRDWSSPMVIELIDQLRG